jgi:hypothetical protein
MFQRKFDQVLGSNKIQMNFDRSKPNCIDQTNPRLIGNPTVHFGPNLAGPKSARLGRFQPKQGRSAWVMALQVAESGERRHGEVGQVAEGPHGKVGNPFWAPGLEKAHRRWRPMVAHFSR